MTETYEYVAVYTQRGKRVEESVYGTEKSARETKKRLVEGGYHDAEVYRILTTLEAIDGAQQ